MFSQLVAGQSGGRSVKSAYDGVQLLDFLGSDSLDSEAFPGFVLYYTFSGKLYKSCLLYTSDAADE